MKNYNEIEAKDNMKINKEEEEVEVKAEKKELKSVVSAKPKKVKKSLIGRLVSGVMGPEGVPSIGAYVNDEIIKPAIKNIIVDAVTSGINMVMYGEKGGANRSQGGYSRGRGGYAPRTNYTSRYTSSNPEPAPRDRIAPRPARGSVDEYILEDRYDAAHVLTTLTENADRYDNVSVADYYDLIGVPSQYTDNNYGWTIDTIGSATILPVRGGYVIKFPPVEVIN